MESREENEMEDLEAHHLSLSLVSLLVRSTTKGDNEHVSVPHIRAKYGADLLVWSIIIGPISVLKLCQ